MWLINYEGRLTYAVFLWYGIGYAINDEMEVPNCSPEGVGGDVHICPNQLNYSKKASQKGSKLL